MGIVEDLKKKLQGDPYHKVEVVVDEIDKIITSSWKKIEEERTGTAGQKEKSGFEFFYQAEWDKVKLEMNYNHPYVEMVIKSPKKMMERKIVVSEFVGRKGLKLKPKNQKELEKIVNELINKIEER